jgi:hypothetical protein
MRQVIQSLTHLMPFTLVVITRSTLVTRSADY